MTDIPPKPKKPLNAFFKFVKERSSEIQQQYPGMNISERTRKISEIYKQLTPEQLAPYQEEFVKEMIVWKKVNLEYMKNYGEQLQVKEKKKKNNIQNKNIEKDMQVEIDNLQIPSKPKKPLTVYFQFRQQKIDQFRKETPDLPYKEIVQKVDLEYKKQTPQQLQPFQEIWAQNKIIFDQEIEKWKEENQESLNQEKEIRKKYQKLIKQFLGNFKKEQDRKKK